MHRAQVLDTCSFSFVLFSRDLNSIHLSFACYPVVFSNPICFDYLSVPALHSELSLSFSLSVLFFFFFPASPIPSARLRAAVSPVQEPAALHGADSDDGSQASPFIRDQRWMVVFSPEQPISKDSSSAAAGREISLSGALGHESSCLSTPSCRNT